MVNPFRIRAKQRVPRNALVKATGWRKKCKALIADSEKWLIIALDLLL
jgi:hypothetical protein